MSLRHCTALAGGVLLALGAASSAAAADFTFKIHHFTTPKAPTQTKLLEPWKEQVEKASGGRIAFEIYPNMQLGGAPPQLVDQVRDGVVDMVWTLPGYSPNRFLKTEVFELPFVHTNPVATGFAINEYMVKNGDEYAKDMHVVHMHVHAGGAFHSYNDIKTLEDFKGLKIRTPTRTSSWLIEALGATPVAAPVPQVPEMLSKKVVDTVMIPFEILLPLKVHEMVDNHILLDDPKYTRVNTSVFLFAMNKARYAALPADLKKVIDDHSGTKIADWVGKNWIIGEEAGEKAATGSGKINRLPAAEVAKMKTLLEKNVTQKWIEEVKGKGIDGAALVAEARALVDKHTK